MVEVYKASGVNFALLCTNTVDMLMDMLKNENVITKTNKYKDGVYFELDKVERARVDDRAKEICISKQLLSLSSNRKFSASK